MNKIILLLTLLFLNFGCKEQNIQSQNNNDNEVDDSKLEYFEVVTPNTFADGMYEFGYKGQCFLLTKVTIYDKSGYAKSTSISTIKINCNDKDNKGENANETTNY